MAKYAFFQANIARVGTVNEVIEAPRTIDNITFQLDEMFTSEFITWLRPCPDEVVPGWTYELDTDSWTAPVPEEP